jgi:flagellar biosynthesis protein FlhF
LEQGIAAPLAQQVIQTVADELSRWAIDNQGVLNQHVHWHLGRRLTFAEPLNVTPGRSTVFFLVGPTGVGKTATIAKLSANLSRAQRARVLIITTDTFRVGAISQVAAYGQILGIPVEVAYNPPQLAALVTGSHQYDFIMVDTPGRNQRVADQVADLSRYVSAVPRRVVHLALAAGAKCEDMRQTAHAFGSVTLNGLVFTKLDETSTLGPAYTLACETGLPLSYLTTGLRVPEDIEVATPERLVDAMVGRVPGGMPASTRSNGGRSRHTAAPSMQEVQ